MHLDDELDDDEEEHDEHVQPLSRPRAALLAPILSLSRRHHSPVTTVVTLCPVGVASLVAVTVRLLPPAPTAIPNAPAAPVPPPPPPPPLLRRTLIFFVSLFFMRSATIVVAMLELNLLSLRNL